jgi:hypothetical protein
MVAVGMVFFAGGPQLGELEAGVLPAWSAGRWPYCWAAWPVL